MKKIIYLLVTLFTILGHQLNAQQQQIGIVTGSAIGNIGDIVDIPVNVILPPGSQLFESCQGAIISMDPSVAVIVGATSNFVTTVIVNNGTCNFLNSSGFINLPASGVLLTLQVQIVGNGCSDFTLTELVGPPTSSYVEFVVDNVFYDDLATDFNINEGTVCGQGCSCDINNLAFGPINYIVNPSDCSTTKVNIPPVLGCDSVEVSHSYNYQVFIGGTLIYQETSTLDGFIFPFNVGGAYTIVITYTIVDDSGCTQQITLSEDYIHEGCNCSCDISNLTLGPIDYTVNTNDCTTTIVNIPPVLGCDSVEVSHSYNYQVFIGGTLIYQETSTLDGFIFPFNVGGAYTIVITYTIVDDSGCTQQITLSEDYTHTGCGCACDISSIVLGTPTVTPDPLNCSCVQISIPPVTGCSSVMISESYKFKIQSANGTIYEIDTPNPSINYCFPAPGPYSILVRYTIIDQYGCDQSTQFSINYNFTGCDCQLLGPPTFLDCQPGINPKATFHTLFWTPVAGASSYEIQFIYNDPFCCKGGSIPTVQIVSKTSTSMNVPNGTCYSWRVRSVCPNGTKSAWSNKDCSCGLVNYDTVPDTLIVGDGGKSLIEPYDQVEAGQLHLAAVPNPATNHVDITLSGLSIDVTLIQPKMVIYDMTGKVLYSSELTLDETSRVDLSTFNAGVYFIKVVDEGRLITTEKLIVQ